MDTVRDWLSVLMDNYKVGTLKFQSYMIVLISCIRASKC